DYFSNPLPAPQGETEDMGILLATKDNRFSLRANKYESSIKNGSISRTFRGFIIEQSLWNPGTAYGQYAAGTFNNPNWEAVYGDQMDEIFAAHLQFQHDLVEAFPEFVSAWINQRGRGGWAPATTDLRVGVPPGVTNTEDAIS